MGLWLIPLCLALVTVMTALLPVDGWIGHDYYHAIPRLIVGADYFWKNGFSLPHYSAAFGGGLPFLADPQSYFFSLPQLLSFFVDPFVASLLSILVFYLLGYWGAFRLFSSRGYSVTLAHFGALLFILNGFAFAHLFVGHLTHHAFLLFPWLYYFTLERNRPGLVLLLVYCLYGGAIHIFVVFLFGLAILLPFLGKKAVSWVAGSVALALFAASAKIVAGALYARHFAIRSLDLSGDSLTITFLRYFWFLPGSTPTELPFGGMVFGAWEFVGFLSKLSLLAIIAIALRRESWNRRTTMAVGIAIFVVLVGYGRPLNSFLPFLSHYHNPIKLWAALIPAAIWLTVIALERYLPKKSGTWILLLSLLCVGEFRYYIDFFTSQHVGISFPYEPRELKPLPPVTSIVDEKGTDQLNVLTGRSSISSYEPQFGYDLAGLKATVVPGPVDHIRDGKFNLHRPDCFLYARCQPWDRIEEAERESLVALQAGLPAFPIPWWHRWLFLANLVTVIYQLCQSVPLRIAFLRQARHRL